MGRYNFYNESPNDFDFMDEDLFCLTNEGPGPSANVSEIDHYDFYYNVEESQKPADPSLMDSDFIFNIQLPTSQRWSYFLHSSPALHDDDISIAYPDLIVYATDLEAELDHTIHTI
jgi:hypothetical protein